MSTFCQTGPRAPSRLYLGILSLGGVAVNAIHCFWKRAYRSQGSLAITEFVAFVNHKNFRFFEVGIEDLFDTLDSTEHNIAI